MKVLVACEYSGTVRDAFTARGHTAISCDLLPTESPGPHWHGDIFECLAAYDGYFDLMIAHPPCTYLSVSGMHWTTRGIRDPQLTEDALEFCKRLMAVNIKMIALENPVSVISSRIRKPDQIIQPWWFGDDASKKTCLWLKNLPKLVGTNPIAPAGWKVVKFSDDIQEDEDCPDCGIDFAECDCFGPTQDGIEYKEVDGMLFGRLESSDPAMRWANQTASGQNKLGPSNDRWKIRSKTYQGIANGMAEQWGAL